MEAGTRRHRLPAESPSVEEVLNVVGNVLAGLAYYRSHLEHA